MMPFKQFIEGQTVDEDTLPHELTPLKGTTSVLITLNRLSVQNYTANTWIALYQSKQINRFFTVLYR